MMKTASRKERFYGKTKREVKEKVDIAKADIHKGDYIKPRKMIIGEWIMIWLHEYKKRNVRPLGKYKLGELLKDTV